MSLFHKDELERKDRTAPVDPQRGLRETIENAIFLIMSSRWVDSLILTEMSLTSLCTGLQDEHNGFLH